MYAELDGALLEGHFRVERKLRDGGMSTVYLGRDERHGRPVAIKVLQSHQHAELSTQRFHQEVEIAARLTHPHVLPVYASGEHAGYLYYVMPYVEGDTLRDLLERERRLPVIDALKIAAEAADGLHYAHNAGIVHRDIKPGNLFLIGGHAVLADFGIATALRPERPSDLTATGTSIGTPLYMSPEQALDGHADERSDIYSLGCVLYQMLVGEPPLRGATNIATIAMRQTRRASPIADYRPDGPPEVEAVVQRALEIDPAARFQTAADFRDQLLEAQAAARTATHQRQTGRPGIVPIRPNRWWLAAAAALVTASIVFASLNGTVESSPIRTVAVFPFDDLSPTEGDQSYLADGVAQEIRDALSRIDSLAVASGESSVAAVLATSDIGRAAGRLEVDGVVEGSVNRSQGSLRVRIRLTDARTNRQVWGGTFEGTDEDIFALETAIVDSLSNALDLANRRASDPNGVRATDVVTHNQYLRGRFVADDRTPEALALAVELFRGAIERDSTYAPAWAALASTYALTGVYEYREWPDLRADAETAAETAILLDETLAEAYTARGVLRDYEFAWDEAEESYLRALDLNPSQAQAYHWYAVSKVLAGRPDEATGLVEQARHLNPLSFTIAVATGWVHYYRRDLPVAISRLELALDLEPNAWVALQYLGLAYSDQGRYAEAIAALDRARTLNPQAPSLLPALARVYALQGDTLRARQLLEDGAQAGAPMYWLAIGYLALGANEEALAWLERAREAGAWNLIEINTFWFAPLADNARFQRLVEELHQG